MKSNNRILAALVLIMLALATPRVFAKTKTKNPPTQQTPQTEQAPVPFKDTPVVSLATEKTKNNSGPRFMTKNKKSIGVTGIGFYDINSSFESLYVTFVTSNINTAGLGFSGFFEYGFSDKLSGELTLGYTRLLYSNKFRSLVRENFFQADAVLHYYFHDSKKFAPYVIAGGGVNASANAAAPTLDVGIGNYFRVSDDFSVKTELIYKTAIIYNRGEARVGIAYHF